VFPNLKINIVGRILKLGLKLSEAYMNFQENFISKELPAVTAFIWNQNEN